MRKSFIATVALGAVLLAGCGEKSDPAETLGKGQVVATVNGKDVTIYELNAELQGVRLPTGDQRKAIEQAALQQLINRKILADYAREQGIDKSPNYILQERRADEALLVNLLQRQIASKVTPPTRDEADKYIAANPALFADRKIFALDQIQFAIPEDVKKLSAFEPLKTMDQVEQRVIEEGWEYRRAPSQLDSVGANPDLIRKIVALPPGEIFIIPTGRVIVASRITDAKVVPFTGDKAVQYAMSLIQQQKLTAAAAGELEDKVKKAREAVKYQAGYGPPAAPNAAPGTPAAPAS